MGTVASSAEPPAQGEEPAGEGGALPAAGEPVPVLATTDSALLRPAARKLMRLSRFEEAMPVWERIAELAPADVEPRMALARIHARKEQGLRALENLDQVLRLQPHHQDANRLRNKIARAAIETLSRQIHAEPDIASESIAALEPLLGGYAEFQRLKLYHETHSLESENGSAPSFEIEAQSQALLQRLNAAKKSGTAEELDSLDEAAVRMASLDPAVLRRVAELHGRRGDKARAIALYRRLAAHDHLPRFWLEAAELALRWGDRASAVEFCRRATHAPTADGLAVRTEAAALLAAARAYAEALAIGRDVPAIRDDIGLRAQAVRTLFDAGEDDQALAEVRELLSAPSVLAGASEVGDGALKDVFRRVRSYVWRTRAIERIGELERLTRHRGEALPRTRWILGMLASAKLDAAAAKAHFAAIPADDPAFAPEIELALLYERLHHFGEAHATISRMGEVAAAGREHASRFARLKDVVEFCGWREDLLYPECLIDVIFEEIAQGPLGYEPREGHLLTATSSLRPGGSERQTVTVLAEMARDPRIERIVLAIRSDDRDDDRTFLRRARELPVDIVHYGSRWTDAVDMFEALPGLRQRPRFAEAIELLPHNFREDIVRLAKLILKTRPKAVHLRQDLFAGAIACALAGVPKFLCHRGSLSPDLWGLGPFETHLFLRPMRHTYRKLFASSDFVLVNNSTAGAESDRAWTEWPDASRFPVIYNAVEFDRLARDARSEKDVRAQHGIPKDAFLVAGVFRVEAVKRPRLWIEAAAIVAGACPEAHFAVLGGGTMAAEMHALGEARGIGGRLHMPGFVSNVAEWLSAADLVLLTSEREGLPNVLIEGQYFGVPAVTSDVGGAFETIEAGITGTLVPPDAGAQGYAAAIMAIVQDAGWRARAKSRAPAFVQAKFGSRGTVEQLFVQLGLGTRHQGAL